MPLGVPPDPPKAFPELPQSLPRFPQGPCPRDKTFFAKVVFGRGERPLWNTPSDPPDPPDPANRCHELRLGPSLPRAPGARMTVVKQTPSN